MVEKVEPQNWNKDIWKTEHPIDYLEIVRMLNSVPLPILDDIFLNLVKMTRLYLPDILFKYYCLDNDKEMNRKKLQTLSRSEIYLSNLSDNNDPFDGRAAFYDLEEIQQNVTDGMFKGDLFERFIDLHIGASLTELGVQDMSMWSNYSNKHRGYCISYKVQDNPNISSFAFPIQYIDSRIDLTEFFIDFLNHLNIEVITQLENGSKQIKVYNKLVIYILILFNNIKSTSWKHEKEFRISVSGKKLQNMTLKPYEIYVGKDCEDKYTSQLLQIGRNLGIPVFKMMNPSKTQFGLETELIFKP